VFRTAVSLDQNLYCPSQVPNLPIIDGRYSNTREHLMYTATQPPQFERRRAVWCPAGPWQSNALSVAPPVDSTPPASSAPEPTAASESLALRQKIELAVAISFDVAPELLSFPSRGRAPVCQARQVSMYVAHVCFSLSMTQVGQMFGRDRSTVAHACEVTEQRRDNAAFDAFLSRVEMVIRIMCGRPGPMSRVTRPAPRIGDPTPQRSGKAL
jgi:Bacterial dnaA protein helix-turn-helix